GISCDVVRLNKRGVEQIAQRDRVARLEFDIIFASSDEGLGRNRYRLIEIAALMLGPVEDNRGGCDLGQTSNLPLLFRLLLLKNIASPRINNDERLSGNCCAKPARPHGEREDDGEKSVRNHKDSVGRLHLIRRLRVGNTNPAANRRRDAQNYSGRLTLARSP